MSKLILSYLFKTNLSTFRSAILDDNTDKICRILDIERDYLNKYIDSEGNTALLLAIEYASPLTVRLLLEQGALPDQSNGLSFQTPLGLLASKVYEDYHSYKAQKVLEMVKILLDHGAYIDKPSPRIYRDENNKDYAGKETPLMTAVRKRNLPLAKLLIEKKANVNYIERKSQIRSIHFAITNGDEEMFDLLENAGGFCSSVVTVGDNTLLHWFCYKNENDEHISLLKKLIEKGCDLNACNWDQRTPIMIAAKNNMTNTCRILLKNNVNIDKRDVNGNQAIDLSIPGSECSKLLLQEGNNQKLKLKNSPSIKPSPTIIWRKRIDSRRRFNSQSSDLNKDEINSPCISLKPFDEEKQTNLTPHPYIYPVHRTENEEIDTKYEYIWEKILQTSQKQKIFQNLYKQRGHSVDTDYRSPL